MRVFLTGAYGFIGKNLSTRLRQEGVEVIPFGSKDSVGDLSELMDGVDFVLHVAGVNRPKGRQSFTSGNVDLTQSIITVMQDLGLRVPLLYTSSVQAELDNPYGVSKGEAEERLRFFAEKNQSPVLIYRLPNVFGKWCRPNYNSVVATFCFNILNEIDITIDNGSAQMQLVYIDDVVDAFVDKVCRTDCQEGISLESIDNVYDVTVGEVANQIYAFKNSRTNLVSERVGTGFCRALYSTYLSYMEPGQFSYEVPMYGDSRGVFSELVKTPDCGQFSFFSAEPGEVRGGHYHHTKNEKFVVVSGVAKFGFRHLITNEFHSQTVSDKTIEVVETVPGWTHNIENIGKGRLVVMLWANEVFDKSKPDTFVSEM